MTESCQSAVASIKLQPPKKEEGNTQKNSGREFADIKKDALPASVERPCPLRYAHYSPWEPENQAFKWMKKEAAFGTALCNLPVFDLRFCASGRTPIQLPSKHSIPNKLLFVGVVEWEMLRCVRRERIYAFRNVARSTRERWMAALWI